MTQPKVPLLTHHWICGAFHSWATGVYLHSQPSEIEIHVDHSLVGGVNPSKYELG